ncbi:hypothetical protein [Kordiimonas marina]|uniref:hypothetical protein n=1 Tax=Kordiimonas marina TaxID=2872312 RepID=UPI001FF55C7A|nr:hypothetical protein [Kordiimonas marina]MCJ9428571.1 hypothetical protein [Kordiimonas marina]
MMTDPREHTTPQELRTALIELTLCAVPFAKQYGRGRSEAQKLLMAAIVTARDVMNRPTAGATPAPADPKDPDALIRDYIAQGGDWQALITAINRNANDAVYQRYQQHKKEALGHEQAQSH